MQNSSSKVQARLPKSQPGTLSEARKNKKGKRYPHLHCLPARGFQGGSSKVSPGSRRVPAMFQRDLSKVPAGFQQGSSEWNKVPARFSQGQGSSQQRSGFPEHAFCWRHPRPQRLKPNRIAVGNIQIILNNSRHTVCVTRHYLTAHSAGPLASGLQAQSRGCVKLVDVKGWLDDDDDDDDDE